ncbi:MAG: hypothetical protein AAGK93_01845 [Pseudomonadota bacterium]
MSDETGIDEETDVEVGGTLPSPEVIMRMLKDYKLSKADMDEHRGKIGALVQDGENTHNVHRKAFKLLTQVENMDDSKRSEFLFHFVSYLGMMGLAPHPDLFEDDVAKEIAKIALKDQEVLEEAEAVH